MARAEMAARGVREEVAASWWPKGYVIRKMGCPLNRAATKARHRQEAYSKQLVFKERRTASPAEIRRYRAAKMRAQATLRRG
jgi:hypothetical protein